jgi:hypothetical protein
MSAPIERQCKPANKEKTVPVFKDTAQLYDCVSAILAYLRDFPPAGEAFLKSGLIIRFNYSAPDGTVTIDGSRNPIDIFCGPCDRVPTVDATRLIRRTLVGQGEPRRGAHPRHDDRYGPIPAI